MTANDVVVLQAHFKDWKKRTEEVGGIEPWLYYCVEQFLKPYALDDEELQLGITEGGGDGSVDAFYFIVNQRQLVTEEIELTYKTISKIRLLFIQVKTSGGFRPTEIEKWLPLTDDFFNLTKSPDSFGKRYNDNMKKKMALWREHCAKILSESPEFSIDYYYITGSDVTADDYANDACKRVEEKAKFYSRADCKVHLIGATELWTQAQKRPPKNRTIAWAGTPMSTTEGYVGLVALNDFGAFLEDEPGLVAERIFESNVRGYQQDTSVNQAIAKSLGAQNGPNFWLLNNGVTIIASNVTPIGHMRLNLEDPQIVNGLQTSRLIFSHFDKTRDAVETRTVLVRVIQITDQETQASIIRATNSQNRMQPASLRMTDQIHRDIEELFKRFDLFYDRRKGFYRDQGKPIQKIVSVNDVTQSVISILLQRPDDARARPGDYFKDNDKYESVFANQRIPLSAYLLCIQIMQRIEAYLRSLNINRGDEKNLKYYVAALLARDLTGLSAPVHEKLPNVARIDDKAISSSYQRVRSIYLTLSKTMDGDSVARGPLLLKRMDAHWNRHIKKIREQKAKLKAGK